MQGRIFEIETNEMLSEPSVKSFVHLVENEIEEIESGNEGWREVDILGYGLGTVVLGADRVGSSEDGGSGI